MTKYDFALVEKLWKDYLKKAEPFAIIAKKYGVHKATIGVWISRYLAEREGRTYKFKRQKSK